MVIRKVSVVGCGAFGYALGLFLSRAHPKINFYFFDIIPEIINHLKSKKHHPFFHKKHSIGKNVIPTRSEEECLKETDLVIMAVPAQYLRAAVENIFHLIPSKAILLNVSKALERKTNRRMSQVINESLGNKKNPIVVISGGMLAHDIVAGNLVGADLASKNSKALDVLKKLFEGTSIKVNTTKDLIGVELGGSFKNVIAIGAGMIEGMGLGSSSISFFISKATSELKHIANKMGAKETNKLLNSWEGDIMTTCFGDSRNKLFGTYVGKGMSREKAISMLRKKKKHAEGVETLRDVKNLLTKYKINAPFVEMVYDVVHSGKKPDVTLRKLINKKS